MATYMQIDFETSQQCLFSFDYANEFIEFSITKSFILMIIL